MKLTIEIEAHSPDTQVLGVIATILEEGFQLMDLDVCRTEAEKLGVRSAKISDGKQIRNIIV
jgi:hypothetical protein